MKIDSYKDRGFRCVPEDGRDGFKGDETWLLEALNAYYSHRIGYLLPASKVSVLRWMLENGWTGVPRFFPNSPARFRLVGDSFGDGVDYREIKRLMKGAASCA